MANEKVFLDLKFKENVPNYKAISAVMMDALRITLDTVADEKQGTEWIDELEKKLIFAAKSFDTTGISIDEEAESFGIALQLLQGIVGAVRTSIIDKQ